MVFGKESTPREISKAITAGKIPPQHIGPKSFEIKKQELISHIQNYQQNCTNAQKKAWLGKKDELVRALESR